MKFTIAIGTQSVHIFHILYFVLNFLFSIFENEEEARISWTIQLNRFACRNNFCRGDRVYGIVNTDITFQCKLLLLFIIFFDFFFRYNLKSPFSFWLSMINVAQIDKKCRKILIIIHKISHIIMGSNQFNYFGFRLPVLEKVLTAWKWNKMNIKRANYHWQAHQAKNEKNFENFIVVPDKTAGLC